MYPNPIQQLDWNFTTTLQPGLNNRSVAYARGKVLGGSSSINYLVYNRGSADDWDTYVHSSIITVTVFNFLSGTQKWWETIDGLGTKSNPG
jgi:choline dehydrogenase-like flavoprotein